jgi:beta-galactosidase
MTPFRLLLASLLVAMAAIPTPSRAADAVPQGFNIQVFDDAGNPDAQPHIQSQGDWTFDTANVSGPLAGRSAAFGGDPGQAMLEAVYKTLPPDTAYWVGLLYVTEREQPRRQMLTCGGQSVHDALDLPQGQPKWFFFPLPPESTRTGSFTLEFLREAGPNAIVSAVALFSQAPVNAEAKSAYEAALGGGAAGQGSAGTELVSPFLVTAVPKDFHVIAYDDCGIPGRQPHMRESLDFTFPRTSMAGTDAQRSVAFSLTEMRAVYDKLPGKGPYFLEMTVSADPNIPRLQSLRAGSVNLFDKWTPPTGAPATFIFKIPAEAIKDGQLVLTFTNHGGHNCVVAELKLWGPEPGPVQMSLQWSPGLNGELAGQVINSNTLQGVPKTPVATFDGEKLLARTETDKDGRFHFDGKAWRDAPTLKQITLRAGAPPLEQAAPVALSRLFTGNPLLYEMPQTVPGIPSSQLSLDGTWEAIAGDATLLPPEKLPASGARPVKIPGQLAQQGFKLEPDQYAYLKKRFQVPADWAGHPVSLRFEAVHGNSQFWVNGKFAGASERLFNPVDLNITDLVTPGQEAELVVAMKLNSDAERLAHASAYASHSLLGIPRPVLARCLPVAAFRNLVIKTVLDAHYRDAVLEVGFQLEPFGEAVKSLSGRVRLLDSGGKMVAEVTRPLSEWKSADGRYLASLPVAAPALWTAETPNLYRMEVEVLDGGKPVAALERNVGFRNIRVSGSQLLVNGRPVKLFGANRHEIDPLAGRADTVQWAETDAKLFKEANINYVRTSHYPHTREFLDACDRIGLYVEAEGPFCWTRGKGEDNPALFPVWLEATATMLATQRNHPSVIIWSIANESNPVEKTGLLENYRKLNEWVLAADPTRPTTINNEWNNNGGLTSIANIHYPPNLWEANPDLAGETRPVLIDEHMHNHCYNVQELEEDPGISEDWPLGRLSFCPANIQDPLSPDSTVNRLYNNPLFLGGAIWAGIDEVFLLPGGEATGYGPWGFVDVWRRKKPEHWHTRMLYSPVFIPAREAAFAEGQRTLEIPVENRFAFTALNDCKVHWRLGDAKGTLGGPDIAPGTKANWTFPLPENAKPGTLLELDFVAPDGRQFAEWGIRLGSTHDESVPAPAWAGPATVKPSAGSYEISGQSFSFRLDSKTGKIESPSFPLLALPVLHVAQRELRSWFAPQAPPYLQFPDPATRKIENVTATETPGFTQFVVRETYQDFQGTLTWKIDKAGRQEFAIDYTYSGAAPVQISKLGLRCDLKPGFDRIEWIALGLWPRYPDTHIGRTHGTAQARNGATQAVSTSGKHLGIPLASPATSWELDENASGSREFRATKNSLFHAALTGSGGTFEIFANGDRGIRPKLTPEGTRVFLTLPAPDKLSPGQKIEGAFDVRITGP